MQWLALVKRCSALCLLCKTQNYFSGLVGLGGVEKSRIKVTSTKPEAEIELNLAKTLLAKNSGL